MYYVYDTGCDKEDASKWECITPKGVKTLKATEKAIRDDVLKCVENDSEALQRIGKDEDYCSRYVVMQAVNEVDPTLHISARVTLERMRVYCD